ncbi:MAG: GDSL-type esterase/lipase family protein [Solirubrobacteraceae bacterium]
MAEPCRLGLIALGDSITRGDGEPALGVPHRSWSLWLAEALDLPYTNRAVDGALACELVQDQCPRVRADYDVACLYVGVNDARGPDWDPDRFAAALDAALAYLRARATRLLTLTIPLDLGRPRAGAAVGAANALIRRLAGEHDAVCAELSDLRGWRLLQPDAVHPTALGQLEIADLAAALAAAGVPVAQLPSALADADAGRRAGARFALRWGSLLARDLARRRLEAMRLHG